MDHRKDNFNHHKVQHEPICGGCHHGEKRNDTCISLVPIFNHLEPEQMDDIMAVTHSHSYKRGETIYSAGDQSDALYIVGKGRIKIYRLSESGKEQLLRILNPGDFTGELALFSQSIHESFALAMEDVNVCMIKRSEFQELLSKYPSISLKVLAEFSSRLEQSEKQTTMLATETVETRIARFLMDCLDAETNSNVIELPMNKKDLASYLGTTPETISRKLTSLEEEGYIKQISNNKVKILNRENLLFL